MMPLTEKQKQALKMSWDMAETPQEKDVLRKFVGSKGINQFEANDVMPGFLEAPAPTGFPEGRVGREMESFSRGVSRGFMGAEPPGKAPEDVSKVDLPFFGDTSVAGAAGTVAGGVLSGGIGLAKQALLQSGFVLGANALDKVSKGEDVEVKDLAELAAFELAGIGLDRLGVKVTPVIRKKLDTLQGTGKVKEIFKRVKKWLMEVPGEESVEQLALGAGPRKELLALPSGGVEGARTPLSSPPRKPTVADRGAANIQSPADLESLRLGRGRGRSVPPATPENTVSTGIQSRGINSATQPPGKGAIPLEGQRALPPAGMTGNMQPVPTSRPPQLPSSGPSVSIGKEVRLNNLGKGRQFIDAQGQSWESMEVPKKGKARVRNLSTGEVKTISAFQDVRPFRVTTTPMPFEDTVGSTSLDFIFGTQQ